MKGLLAVLCVIGAAVAEAPAPYAPSGWRPDGPAFELPQRGQNPNYLPPVDPRTPANIPDADVDVTVQGLPPRQEQQPIFQPSPIGGQQYVGPNFNTDIRSLDQGLNQVQIQQQKAREFARQKQENEARLPSTISPNQFNPRTTVNSRTPINPTQSTITPRPDFRTTSTTPADLDLNEGETDEVGSPAVSEQQRVSVEVSKQNIQEYPPELFLNPLAQLRLQPLQFGQSPIVIPGEQSQKQVAGFDAQTHFAALPSIIAQQQLAQQQLDQQRALLQQYPGNQAFVVSGQTSNRGFLIQSPQPLPPVAQLQPLVQPLSPVQRQNVVLQPQGVNQIQPNQPKQENYDDDDEQIDDNQSQQPQSVQSQFSFQPQPQVIYQQQPQGLQPQGFQPQTLQPQGFQPQGLQPQGIQQPQLIYQQPEAFQPQAETVSQQGFQPQGFQQPQLIYQQPEAFQTQAETVSQQGFQPQQVYEPQQVAFQTQPALQPAFQQPQADQPQIYQPQTSYQPQTYQPQFYAPDQQIQGQLVSIPAQNLDQFYQQQFQQQQLSQSQGQDALQSGFDVNQQGNSLDQNDKDSDENTDGGATATAVATAFGTRTQPRVFSTYGAPIPRAQNAATTEAPAEEVTTEEGPAIAQATAVARGGRRKSAKLRSRRIRPDSPIFTLDKSGRLVLVSEQERL
ncbi:putative mediator of RNA polymerase II transcription subunit 12 isoform X3 [Cydia pomonella]|uniref:putative mediator of RNA polymerase II transcription subunit 12 isoform X3 n=1 Tax=Cydia pomonella TaxID=82600 RepID=UPI002ADE0997|nr:putative mediator of RNA polymerase II transcription subunit 12 isoform X3 [Cydia pomonella]